MLPRAWLWSGNESVEIRYVNGSFVAETSATLPGVPRHMNQRTTEPTLFEVGKLTCTTTYISKLLLSSLVKRERQSSFLTEPIRLQFSKIEKHF